jgi:hypothetical protein
MQKWEYIILTIVGWQVKLVDGHSAKDWAGLKIFMSGVPSIQRLPEFINLLGKEGWEVIGMVDGQSIDSFDLMLKRPIE